MFSKISLIYIGLSAVLVAAALSVHADADLLDDPGRSVLTSQPSLYVPS